MPGSGANDLRSHIYLGLAGETGRGRVVQSGLYRLADGDDDWEAIQTGLPEAPAIRALAVWTWGRMRRAFPRRGLPTEPSPSNPVPPDAAPGCSPGCSRVDAVESAAIRSSAKLLEC